MHDVRRSGCKGLRSAVDPRDLWAEPEVDLSIQDVERVRVLPVDMRVGAFFAGLVAKPRHDQLLELAEDPQRPLGTIGGRLALARG